MLTVRYDGVAETPLVNASLRLVVHRACHWRSASSTGEVPFLCHRRL